LQARPNFGFFLQGRPTKMGSCSKTRPYNVQSLHMVCTPYVPSHAHTYTQVYTNAHSYSYTYTANAAPSTHIYASGHTYECVRHSHVFKSIPSSHSYTPESCRWRAAKILTFAPVRALVVVRALAPSTSARTQLTSPTILSCKSWPLPYTSKAMLSFASSIGLIGGDSRLFCWATFPPAQGSRVCAL